MSGSCFSQKIAPDRKKTFELVKGLSKFSNVYKILYTSIDAGNSKTYQQIRGRNLFKTVCANILNYAKHDSFDLITLKYILLFDKSNTDDLIALYI